MREYRVSPGSRVACTVTPKNDLLVRRLERLHRRNDTTPRYDKDAATLAWQRTIDFFMKKPERAEPAASRSPTC